MEITVRHVIEDSTDKSSVLARLDLLQKALAGLVNILNRQERTMSEATERLSKEVQETKDAVGTVLTSLDTLATEVGRLNGQLADVTAQLRAALDAQDPTAVNAAADALDQVQADIAGAVARVAPVLTPPAPPVA